MTRRQLRRSPRWARGVTAVEVSAAIALMGSAIVVAVPAALRNMKASRFVEPVSGLGAIGVGAVAYATEISDRRTFPHAVALTPSVPPRGRLAVDPPGTWSDPTWVALEFPCPRNNPDGCVIGDGEPHAFAFAFDSASAGGRSTFVAQAHGDLDGDGAWSTFEIRGHSVVGAAEGPVVEPGMYVEAELE